MISLGVKIKGEKGLFRVQRNEHRPGGGSFNSRNEVFRPLDCDRDAWMAGPTVISPCPCRTGGKNGRSGGLGFQEGTRGGLLTVAGGICRPGEK